LPKNGISGREVERMHGLTRETELDFRYSTCKMSEGERLQKMVDQSAGKRLTYRPLKGQ